MGADLSLFQAITLAVAVVGAVLGVLNTWHSLDNRRVKLIVRPKHAIPVGGADQRLNFCIEVTNLSGFAVTVFDVGFFYRGTESRGAWTHPMIIDGGKWPRRLEPRSSVTTYGQRPTALDGHAIKCAYAKTECGVVAKGTSEALKQVISGVNLPR